MKGGWFDMGLYNVNEFSPHGFCLAWEPEVLSLTIVGNAMVALSYVLIPIQLLAMIRMSDGELSLTKDKSMMALFAAFIFLCGAGHAVDVLTIWFPVYRLQAYLDCLTGIVSLTTAATVQFLFVKRGKS